MENVGIGGDQGVWSPSEGPDYDPKEEDPWYQKVLQTILPGGKTGYGDIWTGSDGDPGIARQAANVAVPLGIGKWAHDYQKDWLAKQPAFPMDETGIKFQTAQEAMADPTLRFKPEAQYANVAEGGRIGYQDRGFVEGDTPEVQGGEDTDNPSNNFFVFTYRNYAVEAAEKAQRLRHRRRQFRRFGCLERAFAR